ncbi:uncharacterized protein BXIN_3104 [Babesia sp. Xinjiang]|uniref:uncharacterized protein n=1 Tax=Babesia sp. Xinjiang TaxID=462227 RepID=UPI000A21C1D2|nr:uncharacterized protein BXIN_3104 [Babesia sp. Xinjiang]ORM39408.1 hypothetical protein BXIN_3104 [Babesia sp. Xinjiang]
MVIYLQMIACVSDKKALALLVATNIFYFSAYILRVHPLRVLINVATCAICLGGVCQMVSGHTLCGNSVDEDEHREFIKSECVSGVVQCFHSCLNNFCREIYSVVLWKSPVKSVYSLVALYIFAFFARILSLSALFFVSIWLFCGWLGFREHYYRNVHPQVKPVYDHVREVAFGLYSSIPKFNESQKL